MPQTEHIIIKVRTVKDIFSDPEPDPDFGLLRSESGLSELENALASQYPRFDITRATFEIVQTPLPDEDRVVRQIKFFCQSRAGSLNQKSRNARRLGRQMLLPALLGVVLLSAAYVAATKLQDLVPIPAGLVIGFLTIASWVVIWQPVELLLYDWREPKRGADIYAHIASLKISIKTAK